MIAIIWAKMRQNALMPASEMHCAMVVLYNGRIKTHTRGWLKKNMSLNDLRPGKKEYLSYRH